MVIRAVETGGPCAGKSTVLVRAYERTVEAGAKVLVGHERATRFIESGAKPNVLKAAGRDNYLELQRVILEGQLAEERWLERLVRKLPGTGPEVLILDRGALDVRAYCTSEEFDAILCEQRLNLPELFGRYDWVGHLVTAADGAEKHYTRENNIARTETPGEARELDKLTQLAWVGHPNLTIIDNSTGFEEKVRRFLSALDRAIGIPVGIQIEHKFVLREPPHVRDLPHFEEFEIKQVWLPDLDGAEYRIRERIHGGIEFYTRTFKLPGDTPLTRIRREERISRREFVRLLKYQLFPELGPMRKRRICFVHDNQYFRVDVFLAPDHLRGRAILEIEPTELNDVIRMPSFVQGAADVTDDSQYTNRVLYERGFPEGKSPPIARSKGWRFWKK